MKKESPRTVAAAVFFLILACAFPSLSPASTPLFILPSTTSKGTTPERATPFPTDSGTEGPAPTVAPAAEEPGRIYAVVLIPEGGTLEVRAGAGSGSRGSGSLTWDASGLGSTGRVERAGPETWVELNLPGGGTGWADRKYLTEYVAPADFCEDGRASDLFVRLDVAAEKNDGQRLAKIVSPVHGLTVTYLHGGIPKVYDSEQAETAFSSDEIVDWGLGPGSGLPVRGTFADLVRPDLLTVFGGWFETHCNTIALGGASYTVAWPPLWKNINYYSVYQPGSPDVEMDWMTWLIGIEYAEGEPYLFSLSRYNWEP
jgi:hypothetical protein